MTNLATDTEGMSEAPTAADQRARQDAASRTMIRGALWCLGGLAVTIGTYSAASPGGMFLICWGPILFGGIEFLQGVRQLVAAGAD